MSESQDPSGQEQSRSTRAAPQSLATPLSNPERAARAPRPLSSADGRASRVAHASRYTASVYCDAQPREPDSADYRADSVGRWRQFVTSRHRRSRRHATVCPGRSPQPYRRLTDVVAPVRRVKFRPPRPQVANDDGSRPQSRRRNGDSFGLVPSCRKWRHTPDVASSRRCLPA